MPELSESGRRYVHLHAVPCSGISHTHKPHTDQRPWYKIEIDHSALDTRGHPDIVVDNRDAETPLPYARLRRNQDVERVSSVDPRGHKWRVGKDSTSRIEVLRCRISRLKPHTKPYSWLPGEALTNTRMEVAFPATNGMELSAQGWRDGSVPQTGYGDEKYCITCEASTP